MQAVVTRTMALYGDPLAVHSFGQEEVGDLGGGLGLGHPVRAQPRGLQRTARLRATGDQPDAVEHGEQLVPDPRGLGGVQPAPEADPGRHHDHVDGVGDDLAGRLEQGRLVDVRHHTERGCDDDGGTPSRESTAQLVGTTLGGDQDPAAREHGPEISHGPSSIST